MTDKSRTDNQDTDSQRNQGRRALLRSIVAGGGALGTIKLADTWEKPLVNSVIIPSHAQTTGQDPVSPVGNFAATNVSLFSGTDTFSRELIADESISEELLEFFLPAAHAQNGELFQELPSNCAFDIFATFLDDGNAFFCGDQGCLKIKGQCTFDPEAASPTCTGNIDIGPFGSNGGQFKNGQWILEIVNPNVATEIALSPGGPGCS